MRCINKNRAKQIDKKKKYPHLHAHSQMFITFLKLMGSNFQI